MGLNFECLGIELGLQKLSLRWVGDLICWPSSYATTMESSENVEDPTSSNISEPDDEAKPPIFQSVKNAPKRKEIEKWIQSKGIRNVI